MTYALPPPIDVTTELERPALRLEIHRLSRPAEELAFTRHTLGLGRSLPGLVLPGDLPHFERGTRRIGELFERDGRLILERHVARDRVTIDGAPLHRQRRAVSLGSWIAIDDLVVRPIAFAPLVPADFQARDREWLDAIVGARSDVGARLVYADVLEELGALVCAEFLRVEVRLLLREPWPGDEGARDRLFNRLAAAPSWRGLVAIPVPTDRCPRGEADCPSLASREPSLCARCSHAVSTPNEPGAGPLRRAT